MLVQASAFPEFTAESRKIIFLIRFPGLKIESVFIFHKFLQKGRFSDAPGSVNNAKFKSPALPAFFQFCQFRLSSDEHDAPSFANRKVANRTVDKMMI